MYVASDLSSFVQQSQNATDFFVASRNAFATIKKSFGSLIGYFIACLGVALIWLLLWFFKRSLKKSFSTEVSLSDYSKNRLEYDLLNKIFKKTGNNNFSGIIHKVPWLFRGTVRLFIDILDLVRQRRDAIGHALSQLDASAPHTDLLTPVLEKDIWAARIKVYDYRF